MSKIYSSKEKVIVIIGAGYGYLRTKVLNYNDQKLYRKFFKKF